MKGKLQEALVESNQKASRMEEMEVSGYFRRYFSLSSPNASNHLFLAPQQTKISEYETKLQEALLDINSKERKIYASDVSRN